MQILPLTPPPLPAEKWPNWFFDPKKCALIWNLGKSILRFLQFLFFWEMVNFVLCTQFLENLPKYHYKWPKVVKFLFRPKRCAMLWNVSKNNFPLIFNFFHSLRIFWTAFPSSREENWSKTRKTIGHFWSFIVIFWSIFNEFCIQNQPYFKK